MTATNKDDDLAALPPSPGSSEAELRKWSPEASRANKELLEKTFASLRAAVFVIDVATERILDCNPAASKMFGYDRGEMLGQTRALLHVDDASLKQFKARLDQAVKEHGFLFLPEFRMKRKDGTVFPTEHTVTPVDDDSGRCIRWVSVVRDNSERKRIESERAAENELLRLINEVQDHRELMRSVTALLREFSGCEAVGIRLREGDDFPYFQTQGFPATFIKAENHLCVRDWQAELQRDSQGNPVLECMCGNIIRGRFNPALPFFTATGSFWTNSTTELLAGTSEADRQARTRNRCHGEGYESVTLVPLRTAGATFGLLQFNDRRKGCFTAERIRFLEQLAGCLAAGIAEREMAESLRASEEKYRAVFEQAPNAIFLVDAQTGVLLEFNETAYKTLGYTRAEFATLRVADIAAVESPEEIAAHMQRIRKTGGGTFETRFQAKDGRLIDMMLNVHLVSLHGHPRFVVIATDITARKQAERTLRENEQFQRDMIDALNANIAVVDRQGTILAVNAAWDQFARENGEKHAARTGVGNNYLDVCRNTQSGGREGARTALDGILAVMHGERGEFSLEYPCHSPDTKRWFLMRVAPLSRSEGSVIILHLNVTERRLAEEALRESEERFRVLFRDAPDPIYLNDMAGVFLDGNRAAEEIIGFRKEEIVGKSFLESGLLLPADVPRALEHFAQNVAGLPAGPTELTLLRKDGGRVSVELRTFPVKLGQQPTVLGIARDATQRKAAEEALRRSERLQAEAEKLAAAGRMAAQVAHEINNPLAGIKNCIRLIRDAVPADHPDRDMVGRIEREIDHIAHVVRQMYQVYSPRVEQLGDIPVAQVVRDVLVMLEPLCRQHEVALELGEIPSELTVRAFPGSLQQIVYNLTSNAIQASPPGAAVRVDVGVVDKDQVRISVCDHGPGIPAEIQPRMFDPFVSADVGDSPRPGLGLGLAIVRNIVESLRGSIEVDSIAGKGTCMHVYLPSRV